MAHNKKQLVLVVEGTAALGPHWRTILSDYLLKAIRSFCGNETTEAASPDVELALVVFNAHGPYSPFLVQRSGWTRSVDYFLEWLSAINFSGGGFCEAAIAEGLAEVLIMCPSPIESQTQQNEGLLRHCILVAASNPYPLPTPVYRPPNKTETHQKIHLFDAEAVAKSFPQSCVSLSVICPRQLPKLKAIYNSGKRNPSAADPTVEVVKNQHYLVLISENFREACSALTLGVTNSPLNQTPEKSASELPPTSVSPVIASRLNQQSAVRNISPATLKAEPRSPQASQHVPCEEVSSLQTSLPLSTSQEVTSNNDNMKIDVKPLVSIRQQPTCPPAGPVNVSIPSNLSQARATNPTALAGGTTTGISSTGGNVIYVGTALSVPVSQALTSSGQSNTSMGGSTPSAGTAQATQNIGTMMATMSQQVQQMHSSGVSSNMATTVGTRPQQTSSAQKSTRSSYVKVWEGELYGLRQGQPVLITRLEAYQNSTASKSLAEDWPPTIRVSTLVSAQKFMSDKEYAGKAEYIIFRAMNQHGFLNQLQEKKLCTVIHLPSQTLLLSVTDKPCRLMGMLFPGDKVLFKSHISQQKTPPLKQQQQQNQVVGTGMNQVSSSQQQQQQKQVAGKGMNQVSSSQQQQQKQMAGTGMNQVLPSQQQQQQKQVVGTGMNQVSPSQQQQQKQMAGTGMNQVSSPSPKP